MSGHSKWKTIAHKKGANDAKRAKIFTKIGREMQVAIKNGGSADPLINSRLKDIIAKAKANNVPNDNINRLLQKYSGGSDSVNYDSINYEGYGPSGIAIIVETLTDNKNRTAADVRHYFDKYGAGLGASGCVSWQFENKGLLVIDGSEITKSEDDVMMEALESGALDFSSDEEIYEIYTSPEDFSSVYSKLEELGYTFIEAEIRLIAQNDVNLENEEDIKNMQKLIDLLEDNDDVQNIYHNWGNEEVE